MERKGGCQSWRIKKNKSQLEKKRKTAQDDSCLVGRWERQQVGMAKLKLPAPEREIIFLPGEGTEDQTQKKRHFMI